MTDVGNFPFLQAHDFHTGRQRDIRLVGIHVTVTAESSSVAESIQRTWHGDDGRLASAHIVCDNDSTVRCVHDVDTAWAAKSANADGLHVEIVGQTTQSAAQWRDAFSEAALRRAARVTALWCKAHAIPVRRLTQAQLKDGKSKGIAGHADIERAFPSTGHSDPGPNFPWDHFLSLVNEYLAAPKPAQPYRYTHLTLKHGDHNVDVAHMQQRLIVTGFLPEKNSRGQRNADGVFGDDTEKALKAFQAKRGLKPDGEFGTKSAAALG